MVTEPAIEPGIDKKLVEEGIEARKQGSEAFWRLGDLALQVEAKYREHRLEEYATLIGEGYQTLRNRRWVASKFPEKVRRPNLSWSHHQAVAARSDWAEWLDRTEAGKWSHEQLKLEVAKGARRGRQVVSRGEDDAEKALDIIEQITEDARDCSDPDERMKLVEGLKDLEGQLYGLVEELNSLRLDDGWEHNLTPAEKALVEKVRREWSAGNDTGVKIGDKAGGQHSRSRV